MTHRYRDQPSHPVRVMARDQPGQRGAPVVADDIGLPNVQCREQRRMIICDQPGVIVAGPCPQLRGAATQGVRRKTAVAGAV